MSEEVQSESLGDHPIAPDSPQSVTTSSPPSAITSPCSSINSQISKRRRFAVPSVSAIAAAQSRSRQRSNENDSVAPAPEARTIRDLILDKKSGLWSKSALERRNNRKQRKGDDESVQSTPPPTPAQSQTEEASAQPRIAPQVRIVDGKIVLDHSSLTFASGPTTAGFQLPVLDEDRDGQAINSSSFRRNRPAQHRWDQASTDKFYAALSKYGTDFETVSRLFKGLNRKHIKNKFKLEERKNRHKVDAALLNRMPIDLNDFPEPEPEPEKVGEAETTEVDEEGREIVDETSLRGNSDKEEPVNRNDENIDPVEEAAAVNSEDDDEALIADILA